MKNVEVYLGIGTNLGDRTQNITKAVGLLDKVFRVEHLLSSFIETEPWGFQSEHKFLNAVVRYVFELDDDCNLRDFSYMLLATCKKIEHKMGRLGHPQYDKNGKRIYKSRIIDIDILLVGDYVLNEPDLKIPHPLMFERDFVMVPLKEINDKIIDYDTRRIV